MPIFMKYEGIKGSKPDHSDWIPLSSAQFGINRSQSPSNRRPPQTSEIVVTKDVDDTSTPLFRESLYGAGKKVIIDFVDKDGVTYLSFQLEGTLITGYSVSQGDKKPMETFVMNCTSIIFKKVVGPDDKVDQRNIREWSWSIARSQAL